MQYSHTPHQKWVPDFGLGYHRIIIHVEKKVDIAYVSIPWRLNNSNPSDWSIVLKSSLKTTARTIHNFHIVSMTQYDLNLLFQPIKGEGDYALYYRPSKWDLKKFYNPSFESIKLKNNPSKKWLNKHQIDSISNTHTYPDDVNLAHVTQIEAYDELHSFYPMEVVANPLEVKNLTEDCDKNSVKDQNPLNFLIFPETRENPIRLRDQLPLQWIEKGPSNKVVATTDKNEYFTFQLGIYTHKATLTNISIKFPTLQSDMGESIQSIDSGSWTCFNSGGVDWLGEQFTKQVDCECGHVVALWIGIDITPQTVPGLYEGFIEISADDLPFQKVAIHLTVTQNNLENKGYNDLDRMSRMSWLNSTRGHTSDVIKPFKPVEYSSNCISILGREIHLKEDGLPKQITSFFAPNNDLITDTPTHILQSPIQFYIEQAGKQIDLINENNKENLEIISHSSGLIEWVSQLSNSQLRCNIRGVAECDGYINYYIEIHSKSTGSIKLDNICLNIPFDKKNSIYFMGLGKEGGFRPKKVDWGWNIDQANNMAWVGSVNAGLQCKLKHKTSDWAISDLKSTGIYKDWSNAGKGGIKVHESDDDTFLLSAFTKEINLEPNQPLFFNFGLLITPFKILDKDHWHQHYTHKSHQKLNPKKIIRNMVKNNANIVNIHHANNLNPYINYPFYNLPEMKQFIQEGDSHGIRTKLYYTIRELTVRTKEFWALWALNGEIFTEGIGSNIADQFDLSKSSTDHVPKFGYAWLWDHLISNFDPAWHHRFGMGHWDFSIRTTNLSRWHNYYLEGLYWLVKNTGMRGIYLDGVGYDREIMKRVRNVLDEGAPDCLIDFHSGNNFSPHYGLNSPANGYLELFPYVNSLWLGEGFEYEKKSSDYWLVEVSGIPFGLFGEMLHGGGNPYRGMVYGMTNRLGWGGKSPKSIWDLWNDFGIQDAQMIGYWDEDSPIKSDNSQIKLTVYIKQTQILIAGASWDKNNSNVKINIDWKKLGWDESSVIITMPKVKKYQKAKKLEFPIQITVKPNKGFWILITKN
jgi:glycosyl hydrolase family 123